VGRLPERAASEQLTHSYASLFGIAASAYLLALIVLCLLAPGIRKAELSA